MIFTHLTASLALLGLAALIGLLAYLQRLRTRHRELVVPTTLFWRHAIEESRARVFRERFRHFLAFLLVALIAALLWLALAGLNRERRRSGVETVYLIDGSAQTGAAALLDEQVERLADHLEEAGAETVIFCGARPRLLLERSENPLLLRHRAAGLRPEACGPTVESTLRALLPDAGAERERRFVVLTESAPSERFLALLPPPVSVDVIGSGAEHDPRSRGISALGVAPADSGARGRVDVLVRVHGNGVTPAIDLDGLSVAPQQVSATEDFSVYRITGLPAAGGLLTVSLPPVGDIVCDDQARLVLPDRAPIRVHVALELRPFLNPVLANDPALLLVESDPDVLCDTGSGAGTVPVLEIVERGSPAFVVRCPTDDRARERIFASIDLASVERIPVAGEPPPPTAGLEVELVTGSERRVVSVARELLSERYDFTQLHAFPVFVAGAIRWLAEDGDFPRFVVTGEALATGSDTWQDSTGRELQAPGGWFAPPRAGLYAAPAGRRLACALPPPPTGTGAPPAAALPAGDAPLHVPTWLGMLAFLLLLLEWRLFKSGRMP